MPSSSHLSPLGRMGFRWGSLTQQQLTEGSSVRVYIASSRRTNEPCQGILRSILTVLSRQTLCSLGSSRAADSPPIGSASSWCFLHLETRYFLDYSIFCCLIAAIRSPCPFLLTHLTTFDGWAPPLGKTSGSTTLAVGTIENN